MVWSLSPVHYEHYHPDRKHMSQTNKRPTNRSRKCWILAGGWRIRTGFSSAVDSVRLEVVFFCLYFIILISSTADFGHSQSLLFQSRIGDYFIAACFCSCLATDMLPSHPASSWGQLKAGLELSTFLFCSCCYQAESLIQRRCYCGIIDCSSAGLDSWLLDRYLWWTFICPKYYRHACDSHVHPTQSRDLFGWLASLI